jgi:hypothetical protein
MKSTWRTLWQHNDIVVFRDEVEVDRLPADRIERVCLLYSGSGDSPGDIVQTLVELAGGEGYALFEAHTGFAGRVNFERQAFWREKACVYWVPAAGASFPWRMRFSAWRGDAKERAYRRLASDEIAGSVARWRLEGPQTWDERKRGRIDRTRPFGHSHSARA